MLSCLACASEGKDGAAGPAGAEGKDGIDGVDGRDGADGKDGRIANVMECTPGNYDLDGDGRRDFTIECHSNGQRKARINYRPDGVTKSNERTFYESHGNPKTHAIYYSAGTKFYERTYYESNGYGATYIEYYSDGTKFRENTTYESSGYQKSSIIYQMDGTKYDGYPKCYPDDSRTQETCTQAKHGCTSASITCIN